MAVKALWINLPLCLTGKLLFYICQWIINEFYFPVCQNLYSDAQDHLKNCGNSGEFPISEASRSSGVELAFQLAEFCAKNALPFLMGNGLGPAVVTPHGPIRATYVPCISHYSGPWLPKEMFVENFPYTEG